MALKVQEHRAAGPQAALDSLIAPNAWAQTPSGGAQDAGAARGRMDGSAATCYALGGGEGRETRRTQSAPRERDKTQTVYAVNRIYAVEMRGEDGR